MRGGARRAWVDLAKAASSGHGFWRQPRGAHGALGDALDPDTMATFAARYGAQVDFERTLPIVERHGLKF